MIELFGIMSIFTVIGSLGLLLFILAWETFEETELGQMFIERLKKIMEREEI